MAASQLWRRPQKSASANEIMGLRPKAL